MKVDKKTVKKSLKYSILDGTFYSMMVGFGESFFMAFAVFLKASFFQQGLIGSLPQSLGYFFQMFSDRVMRFFKSRKKVVVIGAILQGVMYIPIMLVFLFGEMNIIMLILFTSIYWTVGMIISPAWNSWIADLVNVEERGKFFGKRNKIAGIASFITYVAAGLMLQHMGGKYQYLGFILIFGLAFIFRMISVYFLIKQGEPEYFVATERYKFRSFLSELKNSSFGKFTLFMFAMNFSVQVAAPFFTPYMLNELKFSYLLFTIVTATSLITKFMSMPAWGVAIDKYGPKAVLTLSSIFVPIIPFLWLFGTNIYYLIAIQVLSGFVWSGFELSAINYLFDTSTHDKRVAMISYYNVFYGAANIIGALLGSFIATLSLFSSGYHIVFFGSSLFRLITLAIFYGKIDELRNVPSIGYDKLLFGVLTIRPTRGLIFNIIPIPRRRHKK